VNKPPTRPSCTTGLAETFLGRSSPKILNARAGTPNGHETLGLIKGHTSLTSAPMTRCFANCSTKSGKDTNTTSSHDTCLDRGRLEVPLEMYRLNSCVFGLRKAAAGKKGSAWKATSRVSASMSKLSSGVLIAKAALLFRSLAATRSHASARK